MGTGGRNHENLQTKKYFKRFVLKTEGKLQMIFFASNMLSLCSRLSDSN